MSNSNISGDLVSDTPADPNMIGLFPDFSSVDLNDCQWKETETETSINCTGLQYDPDELNIMSYSWPQCIQYFTTGQARRMRHHLAESTTLDPVVIEPETISVNTEWTVANTPGGIRLIDNILVIEAGYTLVVGAGVTVKFTHQGRLIVQPGSTLTLSGKLTGQTCNNSNTWKGVEIWGNSSALQTPANQGRFIGNNGAVIENAEIGLQTWGGDETTGSGGIIAAYGTTFLNCRTAVAVSPFTAANYKADFTRCDFQNTTVFPHNRPFQFFAHLRGVLGLSFAGCRFLNNYSPSSSGTVADFGYGIFSHDAGFAVTQHCIGGNLQCQRAKFEGLGYGVYLGTDKFAPIAHTVQDADFEKCYVGIGNSGVSSGKMVLNHFSMGSLPGPDFSNSQFGVAMVGNLNGFTLEENDFEGTGNAVRTIGILSAQLGDFGNIVRRNDYENISVSNFAAFQNAEENAFPPRGLYYDCNTNTDIGEYDFSVVGTIRSEQGLEISEQVYGPAGNQFSYTGSPGDSDFSNIFDDINYYYPQNAPNNEQPIHFSGILPIASIFPNGCEVTYCPPPCPISGGGDLFQLKQNFYTNKSDFMVSKAGYELAILNEQSTLAAQHRKAAGFHLYQMDKSASKVLNIMLSDTLGAYSRDSIRQWMANEGTLGAGVSKAGDFLSQGNFVAASAALAGLTAQFSLSSEQLADLEKVDGIFSELAQHAPLNLSRQTIQQLEVIAADTFGFAPTLARNLLRLYGHDFPPGIFLPIGERGKKMPSAVVPAKIKISVLPNPATDFVVFQIENATAYPLQITVSDVAGRAVWSHGAVFSEKQIVFDVSTVTPGVYFYQVKGETERSGGKIIVK